MWHLFTSGLKLLDNTPLIDLWQSGTLGTIQVELALLIMPFLIAIYCLSLSSNRGSHSSSRLQPLSNHLHRGWKRCRKIVICLSTARWWDKQRQLNVQKHWAKSIWQIIREWYLKNQLMAVYLLGSRSVIKFSQRNLLRNRWKALRPKRRGKRKIYC